MPIWLLSIHTSPSAPIKNIIGKIDECLFGGVVDAPALPLSLEDDFLPIIGVKEAEQHRLVPVPAAETQGTGK